MGNRFAEERVSNKNKEIQIIVESKTVIVQLKKCAAIKREITRVKIVLLPLYLGSFVRK